MVANFIIRGKSLIAHSAFVRLPFRVCFVMDVSAPTAGEAFFTEFAGKWQLPRVAAYVNDQIFFVFIAFLANLTRVRETVIVGFSVRVKL